MNGEPIPASPPEDDGPVEGSVLDLIADIRSGVLPARGIDADARRRIVECLIGEGATLAEIAQLVRRNERTIRRDIDAIRESNALHPDDGFAERFLGQLLQETMHCIARIRRTTREKDCPHSVRVQGERDIAGILDGLAHRMQSVGHLPSAAHRLEAEVMHNGGVSLSLDDIVSELDRIGGICGDQRPDGLAKLSSVAAKAHRVFSAQPSNPEPAPPPPLTDPTHTSADPS